MSNDEAKRLTLRLPSVGGGTLEFTVWKNLGGERIWVDIFQGESFLVRAALDLEGQEALLKFLADKLSTEDEKEVVEWMKPEVVEIDCLRKKIIEFEKRLEELENQNRYWHKSTAEMVWMN